MKKKLINTFLVSVLFFTLSAQTVFSQSVSFSYDPDAKVNRQLNNTVVSGYYILFNYKYPYIYFKDPANKRVNFATYDYEKQYWLFYSNKFDPAKIDLNSFFVSIDLSKTVLNRDKNGNAITSSAGSNSPTGATATSGNSETAATRPGPTPTDPSSSASTPPRPSETRPASGASPFSTTGSSGEKPAYTGNGITEERKAVLLNYAKAVPAGYTSSVERLGDYLVIPCQNDYEKAFVIYCWVANNIAYDVVSYFAGARPPQDAAAVLRTRKGVCAGYSNLYKALGDRGGLNVAVVSGHGKGYGYRPGLSIDENHAWTGVKIGSQWILADATWGAGYISDQMDYVPRFSEDWFDVDPDEMIFSHLPADSSFQLTKYLWSGDEYKALPKLRPGDFSEVFTPEFVLAQKERYSPEVFSELMPQMPYFIDAGVNGEQFFQLSRVYNPEELRLLRPSLAWSIKSGFSVEDIIEVASLDKNTPLVRLNSCPTVRGMGIKIIDAPITRELEAGNTYTFEFSAENAVDYAVIDTTRIWYYVAPEGQEGQGRYSNSVGTVSDNGVVKITFLCRRPGTVTIVAKPEANKGYYKVLIYTVK